MFCPKCATQNVDGASFCRACGANISLIPHALTGQLPGANQEISDDRRSRRKKRQEPNIDEAVRSLAMGVGFVVVSMLVARYSPGGWTWWYWLLIPAFMFVAKGISELVRLKQTKEVAPVFAPPQMNAVHPVNLPAPRTGELMPPAPSVTEGTTRHLGAEAQTRHLDSQKPS